MGVDVKEAASRMSELLQPEQPSDSVEEATQEEVVTEEPDSELEVEAEAETPEGDTDPEPRYSVKVNGEEQEVSIEDLRKGYMMESDYRKKTSEVARARDELNAKYIDLDSKISDAEDVLKLELEDLNSEESLELKEIDPSEWYAKKEKVEEKAKRLDSLKEDKVKRDTDLNQQTISQEKELLFQALPEWLDEKVMTDEIQSVQKMWTDMDLSQDTLNKLTDHKLVLISRKAMLYDQLMNANVKDKQVKSKPKAATPSVTKTSEEKAADKNRNVRDKVQKTGNVRDAQAAIRQLMK